jgi:ubiquinone/menaquinone biosynthesis C-methylase UbiE
MDTLFIENRYNTLANDTCCLSCGSAIIHAAPASGEVCIDLGSGRGTDVMRIAEAVGPSGFVYGIDIADAMLETARNTAMKLGYKNVSFIKGQLEKIPVSDNRIDLVISNCTINHAHNKQAVWDEIFRILKPGGRFVVSDIYALQDVPEAYRNDPKAIAECWAGAVRKDLYLETVKNAGFSKLHIIEESQPYHKGEIDVVSFTLAAQKPVSELTNETNRTIFK